jgi:hypothetical protein
MVEMCDNESGEGEEMKEQVIMRLGDREREEQ